MTSLFSNPCRVEQLSSYYNFYTSLDVLRLDEIDKTISGNKWFKLKYYLQEAKEQNKTCIVTFGGPYSNHIIATAAMAQLAGLKSIGIIRGEEPIHFSPTLQDAKASAMELFFVNREAYKEKRVPTTIFAKHKQEELYFIPEGGYGEKGIAGAAEILLQVDTSSYTHIVTAVGTGTTAAGLLNAALSQQKIIGISALKNNFSLQEDITRLITKEKWSQLTLLHNYHFGGYAKSSPELFMFMNHFFSLTGVPTDFVYTGKTFFAVLDLLKKEYFLRTDKILVIHTGGLQGNRSLQKQILNY